MQKSSFGDDEKLYLDIIIKTVSKASDLTSKLLSFGRKKQLHKSNLDIHEVIEDALSITKRTTDRLVKFNTKFDSSEKIVLGDFSALQSVLMNLILNAIHAIQNSGEISIETSSITLDQVFCDESSFNISPGTFIQLSVIDSGCGISPDNISKVFDPFYSTKPQGEGTGLGLSSVYGTVFEHFGSVNVNSVVNKGTEFQILLPCSYEQPVKRQESHTPQSFTGIVLLVDDEEVILFTATAMLEKMGFQVISATNGLEAVKIYEERSSEITLCILDMIMPEMNGKDTFYQLKSINNECKVIISSGFTKDESLDGLLDDGLAVFINKPYRYSDLNLVISQI